MSVSANNPGRRGDRRRLRDPVGAGAGGPGGRRCRARHRGARVRPRRDGRPRWPPPANGCHRTGPCRIPPTTADVLSDAVPAAVASAGIDPAQVIGIGTDFTACTVLPAPADGTPLCQLPGLRRPPARLPRSCGSTTRPSRRPTGSTRWRTSAASPGSPGTAARSPPSGSSPRACSCWRRTRRSTPQADRWIEAADWIIWQLCGAETRNACTAGYKGIYQDGHVPVARFLAALTRASPASPTTSSPTRCCRSAPGPAR